MSDESLAPTEGEDKPSLWEQMAAADKAGEQFTPPDQQPNEDAPPAVEDAETPPAVTESDPWAEAPEPLRAWREQSEAELAKLREETNRSRGRQSANDRELAQLRAKVAEQEKARAAPAVVTLDDPDMKELAENYPEVHGPFSKILARQQAVIDELRSGQKTVVTTLDTERHNNHVQQQQSLLERVHPDFVAVVNSDEWKQWVPRQPRYVQEALRRNDHFIVDADEASDVISRFKASTAPAQAPASSPAPAPLTPHRQAQLRASTQTRSSSPSAAINGVGSFENMTKEQSW
jgi:hypothetical protein